MRLYGTLQGNRPHRELIKTTVVTITESFRLDLKYNDVPVTLFYKHGNYPWRSLLINDAFREEGIPRYSDIYLACVASNQEKVIYDLHIN